MLDDGGPCKDARATFAGVYLPATGVSGRAVCQRFESLRPHSCLCTPHPKTGRVREGVVEE